MESKKELLKKREEYISKINEYKSYLKTDKKNSVEWAMHNANMLLAADIVYEIDEELKKYDK